MIVPRAEQAPGTTLPLLWSSGCNGGGDQGPAHGDGVLMEVTECLRW